MSSFDNLSYKKNGSGRYFIFVLVLLGIAATAFGVYKLFLVPPPVIRGLEQFELLPAEKTVTLECDNLKYIEITALQGNRLIELLRDVPELDRTSYSVRVNTKDMGLIDGTATIRVKAKSGIFKEISQQVQATVDTVPPSLEVVSSSQAVDVGGTGFAILKSSDADTVFVELDGKTFRAYAVTGGQEPAGTSSAQSERRGPAFYLAFFPAPFGTSEDSYFSAVAADRAGNRSASQLGTRLRAKQYRVSDISIDDSFITRIIVPLLNRTDIDDPLGAFKTVNEDWRKESLRKLMELSGTSKEKMLWDGRFLQMKNSKVMGYFGDQRTYFYGGSAVSDSVHLGYDLASHSQAPVEAANSGVVRFAGDLSIYGNTIIIDHGLGLMSLYGHLSSIGVSEGQEVTRGEIIGKTGSSGLASGDHLHFGILVHGYEVSPLYWWDENWIRWNIFEPLKSVRF